MNKISQICKYLSLGITNDPRSDFDLAINWRGAARHPQWEELSVISSSGITVINEFCNDVSKQMVDDMFVEVFGYSSLVDPLTFQGRCVEKSNRQAAHDGHIIQCPAKKVLPDHIYQRVINNQVEEDTFRDIRIPVFGRQIPLVFFKNKDVSIRFTSRSSVAHVVYPSEYDYFFPEGLLNKVVTFCDRIGMDYGEVDLLWDKDEKKYYIIDANKTPGNGIFSMFTTKLRDEVITIMAEAFKNEFLK
jgi:hypothetical protein